MYNASFFQFIHPTLDPKHYCHKSCLSNVKVPINKVPDSGESEQTAFCSGHGGGIGAVRFEPPPFMRIPPQSNCGPRIPFRLSIH